MSQHRCPAGLSLVVALLLSGPLVADDVFRSGLQPGAMIVTIFEPLNVNGEYAGQPHCLVCENGLNPVVMIFAREPSDALTRLVVKLDAATVKHRGRDLGAFVVFVNDKDGLDKQLAEIAKKHALKQVILSIDAPGPAEYKVAKNADVTVMLYSRHVVKANHAFKKGELTDQAIDKILADLPKILPTK